MSVDLDLDGREAVPVRPAATVMLVRDADEIRDGCGVEVCMLQRNLKSDFVGGAFVFPGGGVDPADGEPEVEDLCVGLSDQDASAQLGLPTNGLAFWVAAIRESFEEAGVLAATHADGSPLRFDDIEVATRFAVHRQAVDSGARRLIDICADEDLRLQVGEMHYFGHWITPPGAPRRYDTRFFLAAAPVGQRAVHDDREVIATRWVHPVDALAAYEAGQFAMLPPTVASLRSLVRFGSADIALRAAAEATSIPTMAPRVLSDEGGLRIVLPGDPGYDDAYAGDNRITEWPGVTHRSGTEWGRRGGPAGAAASSLPVGMQRVGMADIDVTGGATSPPSEPAPRPQAPLVVGQAVSVSPLVRRVLASNPGVMTGPGTNTYLVGHREVAVIDPGPDDDAHVDAIVAAGEGAIRWVLLTHTHPDHWPASTRLAERTGAEVLAFDDRDGLRCDRHLGSGQVLDATEFTLRALHTPGHASNHLCYLLEDERLLFTGDHLMQGSTVVIAPPDGDMAAYLGSLRELLEIDPPIARLAPAHGHVLDDPRGVIDGTIAHRLEREAKVRDALAGAPAPATIDDLVPAAYDDVHESLFPLARLSLWAHLRKLVADGTAEVDDPDDLAGALWSAV